MAQRMVAIVDDDEGVRTALARLLRSFGHHVGTWGSGEDFLIDPRGLDAACVITDLQMPGMDGLDLQQRLLERTPVPGVIIMTAYPRRTAEAKALAAGAIGFLTKPFEAELLEESVQTALSAR